MLFLSFVGSDPLRDGFTAMLETGVCVDGEKSIKSAARDDFSCKIKDCARFVKNLEGKF